MSIEAKLSSHLTISYSAAPPASGPTASAGGPDAAGSNAPAGKSPAGFLAALVDQLLVGAAGAAQPADTTANTDATGDTAVPAPFGMAIDPATAAAAQNSPRGNVLLAQLTDQLQALKDQLDSGQQPDPDLLKKLGRTADALAALITAPTPPASPVIDPISALDPLASIGQSTKKPQDDTLGGLAGTPQASSASTPSDQVTQFLANLGITLPSPGAGSSDGEPSSTPPLPGIAQLASKLAELGQAIAPAAPDVAEKLLALTQKLAAAKTDPQILAQLTGGSDTDATGLDKIVQSLIDGTSAKPPQIASTTQLQIPAPIAPEKPKSPVVDELSTAAPAPGTGASASKPAIAAKPADTSQSGDSPRPEARIVAAATAAADTKSDAPDPSPQSANPAAAPVAQAAARTVPAAYQAASNPINVGQVAFEMVRQMHQGVSRFNIRIDPPELGRVDVRMHVDAAGNVNARLTVERSETLDMFQRDRGSLEKALAQAGLDSGKTNLEFSLKQNPFAGLTGGDQRPGNGNASTQRFAMSGNDGDDASAAVPSVTLYRGIASSGGVNLFV